MEEKNEMTLEELQQQYDKLTARRKVLKEKIAKRQQEHEIAQKKKLAEEKENRKKAVEDAKEAYMKLLNDYVRDYGEYESDTFYFKTWNYIV